MTQKEVDAVFSITILLYEHEWFRKEKRNRKEVQEWVAKQLTSVGVYTIPKRTGWGSLVTKEHYNDFHNPKEEDNDNTSRES